MGLHMSEPPVPLAVWLHAMLQTCEDQLDGLSPERLAWLRMTKSDAVYQGYLMGMSDALRGVLGNLSEAAGRLPITMN